MTDATPPTSTPGQRAYEAWLAASEHPLLVPWEKLTGHAKSVWEAVARAARRPL